jgi:hypothetical protein
MSTDGGRPIVWAHRDRRDAELAQAVREALAEVNRAYAEFTKATTPALKELSAAYTTMATRSQELQEFRMASRALVKEEDAEDGHVAG